MAHESATIFAEANEPPAGFKMGVATFVTVILKTAETISESVIPLL